MAKDQKRPKRKAAVAGAAAVRAAKAAEKRATVPEKNTQDDTLMEDIADDVSGEKKTVLKHGELVALAVDKTAKRIS